MKRSETTVGREETPDDNPEPARDGIEEERPRGRREIGGPPGPEPTRYGDWEKGGRCIDF